MIKIMRYVILCSVALLIVTGCANERAISGGPEDKEAPEVIYSLPINESVNVDPGTEILIKFNEQMKKSTFESSLQIWPRPPGDYEIKSSWTWLKIKFSQALDSNETYLLTLDKGAQDLRGNGLESTYVMAFSTGNDLNSGHVSGFIHGSVDIKKNGDLLLYRRFDTDLSELLKEDADYVFQPDDKGHFELPYLAERPYTLFYHWDRNRNKRIDGDDYFGRPELASVLATADSIASNHKIWPHLIALDQLKLLGASQLSDQFIQIRMGRQVTAEAIESTDLFMNGIRIPILGTTLVEEDEFAMNMDVASVFPDSAKIWLHNFQDTSGFSLHSDTLNLSAPSSFDTLALSTFNVRWWNQTKFRAPGESSVIRIGANLPYIFQSDSAFQIVDKSIDSVLIPGELEKRNSMEWTFTPDSSLADNKTYQWLVDTRFIYAPLNGTDLDSLMAGSLTTINQDSLGSIKVVYMGREVLECRLNGKGIEKNFKLEPGAPHIIENLPARSYSLSAYIDKDGNGHYNSGGLGPAAKAEPFWIYPDEIKVRARWETDLGLWRLGD